MVVQQQQVVTENFIRSVQDKRFLIAINILQIELLVWFLSIQTPLITVFFSEFIIFVVINELSLY